MTRLPQLSLTARLQSLKTATALTLFCSVLFSQAAAPSWWQTRGVLDTNQTRNDYAAVNTGQLKNIAKKAMLELDAKIPGGAGTAIHQLIDAWPSQTAGRNDYAAVNLGQLKAVAKLFYARLNEANYTQPVPWDSSPSVRNDYAEVNVGQVKRVFAFCVDCTPTEDSDQDGLVDWIELQFFGSLASNATTDNDADELPDWWELLNGLSAQSPNDSTADSDADGLNLKEEFLLKTNPKVAALEDSENTSELRVYSPGF